MGVGPISTLNEEKGKNQTNAISAKMDILTNIPKGKIDLEAFDGQMEECIPNHHDPVEGCAAVKRLITTLRYFTLLDIVKSKDDQDIFSAFICNVHINCLDDYTHFMNDHDNIEQINIALKEKKLFRVCDVRKCQFTSRHYSYDTDISMENVVMFYAKIMESLHFYVLHLFECGLRAESMGKTDDTKDAYFDVDDTYFDKEFARISTIITERQHLSLAFNRFKSNTKFNMMMQTQNETDSATTFTNELYRFLFAKSIKQTAVATFIDFIISNQYDSDAIKADFKERRGNISRNIEVKALIEAIAHFVKSTEIDSTSFNIGLIFYYWPHYKNMEEFCQNSMNENLNDHCGYKVSALFVKQRHSDFKEEMMNYLFFNMKLYGNLITKVKAYMETKNVKQRGAKSTDDYGFELKYDINDGDNMLCRHLISLSLYTDYTDLCTDFSSTFRAIKPFETLSSIKARNSKYWWMAKSLREAVELYGEHKKCDSKTQTYVGLLGPFYCGLTAVMPFPDFEIRLCGPTSTTRQLEIAIRFAKQGIVVQLNNDITNHVYLSGFVCCWLSKYAEEDEVIFMGGHHRIRIQSVRILNGKDGKCQNFEIFFSALSKFSNMFNGGYVRKDIDKEEKQIISKLYNWSLGNCDLKDEFDDYILDTFMAFRQKKQHVVFNYDYLCRLNDKDLLGLIFYGMKSGDFRASKEKTNIFRKDLFRLFQNVKSIDIYATSSAGSEQYALSFASLLSEINIEKEMLNKIIVKAVKWKNKSWISILSSSLSELKREWQKKGYQILFKNTRNWLCYVEDSVVIEKI